MKLTFFLCVLLVSNFMNSQTIEISLNLDNNCLDINRQMNTIQITVQNNSNNNIWINLNAISFTIYSEGILIKPIVHDTIGHYAPGESKFKNGYLLVRKESTTTIRNSTTMFHNYQFDKNKKYCLKGYYSNARKGIFKKIYNIESQLCEIEFSICE